MLSLWIEICKNLHMIKHIILTFFLELMYIILLKFKIESIPFI